MPVHLIKLLASRDTDIYATVARCLVGSYGPLALRDWTLQLLLPFYLLADLSLLTGSTHADLRLTHHGEEIKHIPLAPERVAHNSPLFAGDGAPVLPLSLLQHFVAKLQLSKSRMAGDKQLVRSIQDALEHFGNRAALVYGNELNDAQAAMVTRWREGTTPL